MIQEDKELLLKDLCARLPYGVIIQEYNEEYGYTDNALNTIGIGYFSIHEASIEGTWINHIENVKPYLRPMSSMTEEEFVYFMGLRGRMLQSYEIQSMMKEAFNMPNSITIVTQLYDYLHKMDWLLSKHFDVRGLIPKGLAIEVTKENNPYKL